MPENIDFIQRFAKTKYFEIKPRTIFVEGTSDVRLFELAAKFEKEKSGIELFGDQLAIIAAGEGEKGGAKGVCRELVSFKNMSTGCLLQNGRPKYRFIGLFDNDRAGRQAVNDVRKTDTSIIEFKDVFKLWPVMLENTNLDPSALKTFYESNNNKYKNFDWEIEDLFSEAIIKGFINVNPNSLLRSSSLEEKTHYEWTPDGKARLQRFIIQNGIYIDFLPLINVIKVFRQYFNLK